MSDKSRRDVLRSAAVSPVFALPSREQYKTNPTDDDLPAWHYPTFDHDVHIINDTKEREDVEIKFKREIGSYELDVQVAAFGGNNVEKRTLDLGKGRYNVSVRSKSGNHVETEWTVPEGGVQSWRALGIAIRPNEEIQIVEMEI